MWLIIDGPRKKAKRRHNIDFISFDLEKKKSLSVFNPLCPEKSEVPLMTISHFLGYFSSFSQRQISLSLSFLHTHTHTHTHTQAHKHTSKYTCTNAPTHEHTHSHTHTHTYTHSTPLSPLSLSSQIFFLTKYHICSEIFCSGVDYVFKYCVTVKQAFKKIFLFCKNRNN